MRLGEAALVAVRDEEADHVPALASEADVCLVEEAPASGHDGLRAEEGALYSSEKAVYSEAHDADSRGKFAGPPRRPGRRDTHTPVSRIVSGHFQHHGKLPNDC